MIDTIKIYTMINSKTYNIITNNSLVKMCIDNSDNSILYTLTTNSLKGSYESSLSIRVLDGYRYGFNNNYAIELEGSLHKIKKGQNAYDGYYNIQVVVLGFIDIVQKAYGIILPKIKHWFLQKIDIAICYNLGSNINVQKYINNLSQVKFPRRKMQVYENESIYCAGSTSTLKIYNKLLEFKKHDLNKIKNNNSFNIFNFQNDIDGFIRFECSIKKKKLTDLYGKYIRCDRIVYSYFKEIWSDEFMKLLKFGDSDIKKIIDKENVKNTLFLNYSNAKASRLYNFYLAIKSDGYSRIRLSSSNSTFYRNIKDLKMLNIDFSQSANFSKVEEIYFNPFLWKEVV